MARLPAVIDFWIICMYNNQKIAKFTNLDCIQIISSVFEFRSEI